MPTPPPSASGNTTTALETAAVRLRAHHGSAGRPGGLGHPAAPARTAAPRTRCRAADIANTASSDVRVDHHHHCAPGNAHRASRFHHCESWAASRQRTDHDHRIGCGPSAGHGRPQDTNHGALDRWRHHPAHRDRATDHGRAHHNRAHQHGSVHDHAGVHDQHCTHDRAYDQRRADLDRAGDDHDWADHDRGATTTTGPVILSGSRPAGVSVATVGALLPILGLLYLLRGLVPQAGGTHARRRR